MNDPKIDTPQPSHSRDSDEVHSAGNEINGLIPGNGSKAAKPRQMNPNRTSMGDLRKRAAGILEYITRTQVELAGEKTPPNGANHPLIINQALAATISHSSAGRPPLGRAVSVNGASKLSRVFDGGEDKLEMEKRKMGVDESVFRQMSSVQMMDVLTREIVHWQKDFGKWGDK